MNRVLLFLTIILLNETTFGAESGMPQLNPESFSSQLFWLFVFFTILFISINNYFVPKIMKVRNKREETINSLISESKRINESIEKIVEKINSDFNNQRKISDSEINSALLKSKSKLDEKISNFDKTLESQKKSLSDDLYKAKKRIEEKIPDISVSLSNQIFEKIMGEKNNGTVSDFEKIMKDSK